MRKSLCGGGSLGESIESEKVCPFGFAGGTENPSILGGQDLRKLESENLTKLVHRLNVRRAFLLETKVKRHIERYPVLVR